MNRNQNPYSPPSFVDPIAAPNSHPSFRGRSWVALILAATTALTAILTSELWTIGAIDLGRYGILFLVSLFLAAVILVIVAKLYANGSRLTAMGLLILVLGIILSVVLLALHDEGLIPPF